MWGFNMISLPLMLGMVFLTLQYFVWPDVLRYVLFTIGYAWFCSLSFSVLVHADIWTKTGNIDDAVLFFSKRFNKIYPLIMVIYTIVIASNFFDHVINYVRNWRIFKLQYEVDDMDGFDPSRLLILQKERYWLRKGNKKGKQMIPLARNFNNTSLEDDEEVNDTINDKFAEMKTTSIFQEADRRAQLKTLREAEGKTSRDTSDKRYAAVDKHSNKQAIISNSLEEGNTKWILNEQPSRLALRWESIKNGFQNFKEKMEAKNCSHNAKSKRGSNQLPCLSLSIKSLKD